MMRLSSASLAFGARVTVVSIPRRAKSCSTVFLHVAFPRYSTFPGRSGE
jgi:hypothetical protein